VSSISILVSLRRSGTLPPLSPSISRGRKERYRATRGRKQERAGDTRKGGPPMRRRPSLYYTPCPTPPFLRSFRCPARTVKALRRRNITSAISWRPAAHWLIYTVVRMISLERRVLDVYHRNADTDHRAYRYTREIPTTA